MISNTTIQKTLKVKHAVSEYFEKHPQEKTVQAKKLMPWLIEKGIFNTDNKDGKPIRQLLRDLNRENRLHLIPQARGEKKEININWFFDKV